jgi:hypothetical protein
MEIEAPTMESKGKDFIDELGSFIIDTPESTMLGALGTHDGYNCLMVLSCKKFRRMVVDAYFYHKHCKFRH